MFCSLRPESITRRSASHRVQNPAVSARPVRESMNTWSKGRPACVTAASSSRRTRAANTSATIGSRSHRRLRPDASSMASVGAGRSRSYMASKSVRERVARYSLTTLPAPNSSTTPGGGSSNPSVSAIAWSRASRASGAGPSSEPSPAGTASSARAACSCSGESSNRASWTRRCRPARDWSMVSRSAGWRRTIADRSPSRSAKP